MLYLRRRWHRWYHAITAMNRMRKFSIDTRFSKTFNLFGGNTFCDFLGFKLLESDLVCFTSHCNVVFLVQCGRSSLSQDGGANLQPHFIKNNQTTLNKWMGRPQLLPVIFEIVLRPIWWATGTEQQSPPLQPPKVGGVLRRSQLHRWCCSICWLSTFHISQFCGNHISPEQHCNLPPLNLCCPALLLF